jgi:hypothetical protein
VGKDGEQMNLYYASLKDRWGFPEKNPNHKVIRYPHLKARKKIWVRHAKLGVISR